MTNATPKNIWVVEQGNYSDYRVVGVFSSEANARLVADAINKPEEDKYTGGDATVAEWPIDPIVEDLNAGRQPYIVHMLKDGTVERCERWYVTSYDLGADMTMWRRSIAPAYAGRGIPDILTGTVWATDDVHAIKIANEKRAQFIADGRWDKDARPDHRAG